MKTGSKQMLENILRDKGYRVTSGRVMILNIIYRSHGPIDLKNILSEIGDALDRVTVYRALNDFVKSGIVQKMSLGNDTSYYEMTRHSHTHSDHHHHHIVCTVCNRIEEVEDCRQEHIRDNLIQESKYFNNINSYSLEYFGICKKCN